MSKNESDHPQRVGKCRLESLLGKGGMGVVYRGHHETLDLPVAIKLLPVHLAESAGMADRFMREAQLAARLNHPEVIRVIDCGEHGAGINKIMRIRLCDKIAHIKIGCLLLVFSRKPGLPPGR